MGQSTLEKWIAGGLQAGGAFLFVMAGVHTEEFLLFLAGGAQLGGLLIWGRAWASSALAPSAAPPPAVPAAAAQDQLAQMQEVLLSLQEEVGRLCEDREFYRELYSAEDGRHRALSDRNRP